MAAPVETGMRTNQVQSSTVNLPTSTARAASASDTSYESPDRVSISDEGRRRAALPPTDVPGPASALEVVEFLAITPLGPFWLELPPDGRSYAHNPLSIDASSTPSAEGPTARA